jgi:DNA-binding MarR family transcriptional regulator
VQAWTPEVRRAVRAYLRAVAAAEPFQRELARRYGLAIGDIGALRVLRDRGDLPISQLGGVLCMKASTATNLVDRLERAGLVRRGTDPTDRRVTLVSLSPLAKEALSDYTLVEETGLIARMERLSPAEQIELASLLEQIAGPGADVSVDADREHEGDEPATTQPQMPAFTGNRE